MTPGSPPDNDGPILFMVLLALAAFILVAGGLGREPEPRDPDAPQPTAPRSTPAEPTESATAPTPTTGPSPSSAAEPADLPGGGQQIFDGRFLVAYYGTAGTASLGVLGEDDPDAITRRLSRAAAPFRRTGEKVQLVYELIVTVADGHPGKDGDYSHDIDPARVKKYVEAAHRNDALLLLDIQPGRSDFLTVAKRWEWALRDPWVGLALDPEWRMARKQVPGRVVGSVSAAEVNSTARWLSDLRTEHRLPQKLFVLHQFRTTMIRGIEQVDRQPGLAMLQHVDGFGTPGQKLSTYRTVAKPTQFRMGFKLFYDEDVRRMNPAAVRRVRPSVHFVSFQ